MHSAPSALQLHSADPVCAGPSPEVLIAEYLTPNDLHYVRNHAPVPTVDPTSYRLEIVGLVDEAREFSLADLVGNFERHKVVTTLQCAGNRRAELNAVKPFQNEVMWDGDAVGTAAWAGTRVADLLKAAGVSSAANHVWFDGLDSVAVNGAPTPFGASIGLARAMEDDVVLAYEMNGEPLPADHGAPLRVVIPGAIGARSVKWLGRITLSDAPSDNHFQRVSYRVPTRADGATWQPIETSHLNSFIAVPTNGSRIRSGRVRIAGYAVPGGTSSIVDVEVAIDDDAWIRTALLDAQMRGTWTRWEAAVELSPGEHVIRVRARDSSGAQQTGDLREAWNPKGYVNDAIHTVTIYADAG